MTTTVHTDIHHPDVASFLATIPEDAELPQLTAAYAEALGRLQRTHERESDAHRRVTAINQELVDAEGKDYERLLTERALLLQQLDATPTVLDELQRRLVLAHLAYLHRVAVVSRDEYKRCGSELAAPHAELRDIVRSLELDDSRYARAAILSDEDRTRFLQRRAELVRQMQPTLQQQQRAELVHGIAVSTARQRYGDDVDLLVPGRWPDIAARVVQPRGPATIRSWAPAPR